MHGDGARSGVLDLFRLDGRAAVVTGACAPAGLGRGIALALAEAGADVMAVGTGDCGGTQSVIRERGPRCETLRIDLTTPGAAERVVEATLAAFGRLDILVNNAGIIRRAPFLEFSVDDWDDVMALNIRAVFLLSQAAARAMVSGGRGGRIVNVASLLSFQGGILVPSYTASKSAVAGLTRLVACELSRYGITCNAIAPGYMATENTRPLREDPERNRAILDRIPIGRWGTPADLMGAAVFLASDASAYMSGHMLVVDGGWLAR